MLAKSVLWIALLLLFRIPGSRTGNYGHDFGRSHGSEWRDHSRSADYCCKHR
jgi:hypothetical protein